MKMQEHRNEEEQAPAYGGGEQTPTYGAANAAPPGYGAASEPAPDVTAGEPAQAPGTTSPLPPAYGTTGPPGAYGANPPLPAYGAGEQTPAHGTTNPAPAYGAAAGQPPASGTGGPPPGYAAGEQPPAYGTANAPPPGYAAGPPSDGGTWPPPPGGGYWPWGTTPPPPPPRRHRRALAFVLVAVLGIGVGAATAFGITRSTSQQPESAGAAGVPTPGAQSPPLRSTGNNNVSIPAIARLVSPSVANITSRLTYSSQTSEGTGIVISSSGLVLTNNHVVNDATRVTVQVDGVGQTYTARILGTDRTDDVALLQLEGASGLKAAAIADSSKVAVGDAVVALGNVGGRGGSPAVTGGTITAVGQTITAGDQGSGDTETLHGMLQTDAAIAPGDSGGPLVNASGQVIGMDTAAAASNGFGQSTSIGFAIPINHAISIAREIAAGHGSSTIQIGLPGFMGVIVPPSSSTDPQSQAQGSGLGGFGGQNPSTGCLTSDLYVTPPTSIAQASSGALIEGVLCGTPAVAAGMAAGDVITAVNGKAVTSPDSLTSQMRQYRPGTTVSVSWMDVAGQQHTTSLTLIAGPAR
jgi:S1-C subfamily serine protease